jgi:hypothetical protein
MSILEFIRQKTGVMNLVNPNQLTDKEWYYYSVLKDIEEGTVTNSILIPKTQEVKTIVKEVPVIQEVVKVQTVFINDIPEVRYNTANRPGKRKYATTLSAKYKTYIYRANKKGFAFTLTADEFTALCDSNCFYCGEPATGIDRYNNEIGYTLENSRPCCPTCNWMKGQQTYEAFINKCKQIIERL